LLESHGALTWGHDLMSAYHKMESLEFYAELMYHARVLGGAKELSPAKVQRLYELRKQFGIPGRHPADLCLNKNGPNCHNCSNAKPESLASGATDDVVKEITEKVIRALGMK